jgi:hypothetical protein
MASVSELAAAPRAICHRSRNIQHPVESQHPEGKFGFFGTPSIRWDERLLALPLTRLNASFCSEFPHYPVGGFYEVLEMDRGYDSRTFDCE